MAQCKAGTARGRATTRKTRASATTIFSTSAEHLEKKIAHSAKQHANVKAAREAWLDGQLNPRQARLQRWPRLSHQPTTVPPEALPRRRRGALAQIGCIREAIKAKAFRPAGLLAQPQTSGDGVIEAQIIPTCRRAANQTALWTAIAQAIEPSNPPSNLAAAVYDARD